jgi:protein-tyrosine phosphatase
MIDLHCHILPGIDDGAPTLDVALAMARCAVADGIRVTACTPHIYPGLYDNDRDGIVKSMGDFRNQLERESISLEIVVGADTHLAPDLVAAIRAGRVPTLNDTRYLLLEPPHHVAPPQFEESMFQLMVGGYVPVVTHPERLTWIETHYEIFKRLVAAGVWMQITAGSLTGRFGRRPKYWGERMLDESLVHILATDSHHVERRPPLLNEGRAAAAARVGEVEATNLVEVRPQGILNNVAPDQLPRLPLQQERRASSRIWRRLFGANE